jgi:CheY-like chemotaxis protein
VECKQSLQVGDATRSHDNIAGAHVAVLDLGLPVMDGYELARVLRSRAELAATRVIALTGDGQAGERASSAAARPSL